MVKQTPKPYNQCPEVARDIPPEKYARLRAEAQAPYRGFRKFIYASCAASGGIGAFIFLIDAIAGRNLNTTLPNLALQVGVVALMIWLFRIDRDRSAQP